LLTQVQFRWLALADPSAVFRTLEAANLVSMEGADVELLKQMANKNGSIVVEMGDGGDGQGSRRRVKKKTATTHKLWVYPGRKMLPINYYKTRCLAVQKVKDAMLQRDYTPSKKLIASSAKRIRSDSTSSDDEQYERKKPKKEKREKKAKKASKYGGGSSGSASAAPKPRAGKKTLETEGFTEDMVLCPSGKQSKKDYINRRLDDLSGMTIHKALKKYQYHDPERNKMRNYTFADLRYDVQTGYLKDPRN
jgi:hypothetical protein